MSLLFDIAPEEPEKKSRRKKAAETPKEADVFSPAVPALVRGHSEFLGRADFDDIECLDESCRGTAHDIDDESGSMWFLRCAWCGTGQWVKARKTKITKAGDEDFRMTEGRFAGLTLNEVASQAVGMDYISWAAKEHPRQAVKNACEIWLARSQESR